MNDVKNDVMEQVRKIARMRINEKNKFSVFGCVDFAVLRLDLLLTFFKKWRDEAIVRRHGVGDVLGFLADADKEVMLERLKEMDKKLDALNDEYTKFYFEVVEKAERGDKDGFLVYLKSYFKERPYVNEQLYKYLEEQYTNADDDGFIRAMKDALQQYKKIQIKALLEKEVNKFLKISVVSPSCGYRDEDYLFPVIKDGVVIFSDGAGDGGYSHRYTKIWTNIIDVDILNNAPAVVVETGIVSYYYEQIRGVKKYRYLIGFDDGKLFCTRVYTTAGSVKEAAERLMPAAVRKAKEAGKEVIRQGDVWLVKVEKEIDPAKVQPVFVRDTHKFLGVQEGEKTYVVDFVEHKDHSPIALNGVYCVYVNNTVSRNSGAGD